MQCAPKRRKWPWARPKTKCALRLSTLWAQWAALVAGMSSAPAKRPCPTASGVQITPFTAINCSPATSSSRPPASARPPLGLGAATARSSSGFRPSPTSSIPTATSGCCTEAANRCEGAVSQAILPPMAETPRHPQTPTRSRRSCAISSRGSPSSPATATARSISRALPRCWPPCAACCATT